MKALPKFCRCGKRLSRTILTQEFTLGNSIAVTLTGEKEVDRVRTRPTLKDFRPPEVWEVASRR